MSASNIDFETLIPEFTPLPPVDPGERKPSPWDIDDFLEKSYSIADGWHDEQLVGLARGYELGRYLRALRADPEFDLDPHELLDAAVYFDELYSAGSIGREAIAQIVEGSAVETPDAEMAPRLFAPDERGIWRETLTAPKLSNLKIRSFENIDFASTVRPALVDGLLDREGLSVIYGPSGAGKSFVALDLGVCVATGRPWRGKATGRGAVLLVAAEAPVSIERRILALRQRQGLDDAPVAVVSGAVNLFSSDRTADEIIEAARLTSERFGVRVHWIIVDTLAAASAGSDENAGKDMGAVVGRLQKIQRATGAHVSAIHHEGKDQSRGARGHSSLRAAVDTEINVRDGLVEVTKMRDGELGETFGFSIESVVIGQREDGRLVEAGVLVHETVAAVIRRKPLKGRAKDVADALQDALEQHGVAPPAGINFSSGFGHVVHFDEWKEAFVSRTKRSLTADSSVRVFRREADKLRTNGHVEIVADFCRFL